MVTFLCDGCNETIKKAKVDAHAAKCHMCYSVSCVDCSVSFPGDDYRLHTSCISEAERYEKTVYKGIRKLDQQNSGNQPKKNLTKQERWLLVIEKAAAASPPSLNHYMETLTSLENIPTQEKKFRNFAANSLRLKKSDEKIVSQIWELLMKEKQKESEAIDKQKQAASTAAAEKQKEDHAESIKVSDEENSKQLQSTDNLPSDANIKKAMKKILKKAENNSLKFKVLRKEVKSKLELKKMNDKKLKEAIKRIVEENPKKLKVDGKSVILISS